MTSNSLMARLMESSTLEASPLDESEYFINRTFVPTDVYLLNIALSGMIAGGLSCGLTVFAGESKHYKTGMGLKLMSAYLSQYKDAVAIYYDSEHGSTPSYVKSSGVDPARVLHCPVEHIEQLKFDMKKQLDTLKRGDRVFFFIDSIGNIASKKEIQDAINQKEVADMTRAKAIKSLFRIITPPLNIKDLPCIAICHIYQTQDFFPTDVISGGQGPLLSANNAYIITRAQEKQGEEQVGWRFTLKVEKSRFVREKSKLPITVTYEHGINKYSGLLDLAIDAGLVIKLNSKPLKFQRMYVDPVTAEVTTEEQEWKFLETNCNAFWEPLLRDERFTSYIKKEFAL